MGLVGAGHRYWRGQRARGAVALVLGPLGLILGGLVVATAPGGLGTGNGLGGGIVAMAVGLIGMALGGMALARSRRARLRRSYGRAFGEFAIKSRMSRAQSRSIPITSASNSINSICRHSARCRSAI